MEKRLKLGIYFMVAAVVLMPVAVLARNLSELLMFSLLLLTMLLELVGLVFVALSLFKKRKSS